MSGTPLISGAGGAPGLVSVPAHDDGQPGAGELMPIHSAGEITTPSSVDDTDVLVPVSFVEDRSVVDVGPSEDQLAVVFTRGDGTVVGSYLIPSASWDSMAGIPDFLTSPGATGQDVVQSETKADARAAIGAGTSSLTLGSTGSTAKPGNWVPATADISDASVSGATVLTGTPAQAQDALGLSKSGGTGDGATNDRAAIAAADAAAVDGGVPLRLPKGVFRIGSAITINSPVIAHPRAQFKIDSGATVTLNAGFAQPPMHHVFDVSSGGKARVRTTGTLGAVPDWWGAVGNGTTDDAVALRIAFNDNIAAFGGGSVHIPAGKVYASSMPFDIKSNTEVTGTGTLKSIAEHSSGGFVMIKNACRNVKWRGPLEVSPL